MEAALLAVHVLGGILFVGPVTVAASLFPRYVADGNTVGAAAALHRISWAYGRLALIVPLVGIALAFVQDRMGEIWITIAMVLTAIAGGLLAFRIVPEQRAALAAAPAPDRRTRLMALTGTFNFLWVVVVVLMVVRPGSDYVS